MKGDPVLHVGLVAYEQGFEAVKPYIGVFDEGAAAVQFRAEDGIIIGLPVRGAGVAGNVGFDVAGGTLLAEDLGVKATIGS